MGAGGYLILLFFMAAIALILSQWFRSSSDSPPSPAPKPKPPEPAPIFNQDAFNWKRRLPIIASVAALVVIVLVLSVVFSKGLTRSQAEEMLMSA